VVAVGTHIRDGQCRDGCEQKAHGAVVLTAVHVGATGVGEVTATRGGRTNGFVNKTGGHDSNLRKQVKQGQGATSS
jgi:hypothetical protein